MLYLKAYDCHSVHDVIDVSEHAGHGGDGVTDVTGFQRVECAFLELLTKSTQNVAENARHNAPPATCYSNVKQVPEIS